MTTLAFPSPDDYTGLSVEEATKMVAADGWELRVVREDGEDLAVTADFRDNRLNVAVEGGVVTELVSRRLTAVGSPTLRGPNRTHSVSGSGESAHR